MGSRQKSTPTRSESFNIQIKEDIMSLRINHNMSAANAHRNVTNNSAAQQKTMEKLSSGL